MTEEDLNRPSVLFAASEMAPLVKTGGLADVAGSLTSALASLGCDVRVVLPYYGDLAHQIGISHSIAHLRLHDRDVEIVEYRIAPRFENPRELPDISAEIGEILAGKHRCAKDEIHPGGVERQRRA